MSELVELAPAFATIVLLCSQDEGSRFNLVPSKIAYSNGGHYGQILDAVQPVRGH